jgi:hypothetical protein
LGRQLRHRARAHRGGTPLVLSRLGRDTKRTHEGSAPRNPQYEANSTSHLVDSEKLVKIKVEPGTEEHLPAKWFNDIFVRDEDLAESIHSDQTGAFRTLRS